MVEELPLSRETRQILLEARDIARQAGRALDSSHVVLAGFTVPCVAQSIMLERRISCDRVLGALRELPPDPPELFDAVWALSAQIAVNVGSAQITSAHVLLAVSRLPHSRAARVLERVGLPLPTLRALAMAHLTDPRLRRAASERLARSQSHAEGQASGPLPETSTCVQTMVTPEARAQPRDMPEMPPDEDEEAVPIDFDVPEGPEPVVPLRATPKTPNGRYVLDPGRFPTLVSLGRNLSLEADLGKLDPLIGRQDVLEAVIDVLSKRRSNNPLLLGDPGVGKTAIVEGLANYIVHHCEHLPDLGDRVIVSLSVADLLAGTAMRGSFAARMKALKDEVVSAERRVILFIDEIHTIIGAGVGDGGMDAANDLKGALARGLFPCIGATTFGEYKRSIQTDPALARRFEPVFVREPSLDETERILDGVTPVYESFHGVTVCDDARKAAVRLTDRVIVDRALPAKAIDVLDRAGARVRREGRDSVTRGDVVKVLAGLVDLPEAFLALSPSERLRGMEQFMAGRVFGHDEALGAVFRSIGQNWSRFGSRKPLGSFLFVGPTGVGKRTTAMALGEFMFGSPSAVLEIDLGDYAEPHSLSHLIGSPPGYVGHEEGGLLADTLMRRPFLLILWQHIDQAHPSVQNLIAQAIADGTLTDRRGRTIDFRNSVHCMTVTLGHDGNNGRTVGFDLAGAASGGNKNTRDPWVQQCRRMLPVELFAALDQAFAFRPLSPDAVRQVVSRILTHTAARFEEDHAVRLVLSPAITDWVAGQCRGGANGPGSMAEGIVTETILTPATQALFDAEGPAVMELRGELIPDGASSPRVVFTKSP